MEDQNKGVTTPSNGDNNSAGVTVDYQKQLSEKEEILKKKDEELSQLREFSQGSAVVINAIAHNPELRDRVKKHMVEAGLVAAGEESGQQSNEGGEKKDSTTVSDAEVKKVNQRLVGVESSQRDQVINEFEKTAGIAYLSDEERKEVRKQIESSLNTFGLSVKDAPLGNLSKVLEKAYVTVRAEKMREEGKLEGLVAARQNELGVMGGFSGTSVKSDDEGEFTSAQRKWLDKLHVNPDKAKRIYLSREKEKDRVLPTK